MDRTKIPKPKLPTKIVKPATTSNHALVPKVQAFSLRRRSKSASDLRSVFHTKPLVPPRVAPPKAGLKRPALQKIDEENNKPKVAKLKIPDWDYKSRFQELQKKHAVVIEEMKLQKTKLSNLPELEKEAETLRNEKQFNLAKLEEITKNEKSLQDRLNTCLKENVSLVNKILQQTNEFQSLRERYNNMEQENKILIDSEKNSREQIENLLVENSALTAKLSAKENAYQHLTETFKKLEDLNNDYLQQISNNEETLKVSKLSNINLQERCIKLENLTQQLKEDLEEHDQLRRSLHNTIQDLKGNIRVFCRVRPPVTCEECERDLCSLFFPNETSLEIRKSRESVSVISGKIVDLKQEFTFDKVFTPETKQADVFEELAQLVQSALDGYHVCVFAYGQTGSGKTYTMQGSPDDYGMIPRTVDLIFKKINKLSTSDWTYKVTASFLEIYNENIKDLLVPNSTHNYEVRFNEGRGVTVTNLQILPITSAVELKTLMERAQKNRAVATTDFNEHSSRSHAVTKIHLEGHNETTKTQYSGSINLVDLAGSESAKTSSAERLTETKNINKSLSALGNVMLALHNGDSHIPYRDSKLTFLLQSCLGGNSKTLMFVNISPFEECFPETINSLRFASKVKEIKTVAKRNKTYC